MLQELEVLCCVLGSDLDVVDPVVLLNVLALNKQLSSLGSLGSLAHVVVQNGTGHLAVNNVLDSLFQCVNTDQVDVLANGTASLLDGLQSAQSHCVVVAEHNFDLLAVLCQSVCNVLLCGGLIPVVQVLVQALHFLAGKEVECLYEYLDNWDQTTAQQDVANALAQYGEKIEVVFCNNDAMALGALQSIEQAGRTVGKDIYLVGVDALKEAVQNVVDGKMTGTVLNDDVGQATKAAEATQLFVEGKDVEEYYWVDYVKVTTENAAQYL